MAGGIGSIKQGGKFDRPSACHYRYHLRNCALPKVPQNDTFQRRNKLEFDHTYLQNINRLQQDIFRLVYSNLDLTEEEGILVKIISSIPHQLFGETTKIYPDDLSSDIYRSKRKCLADSSYESSFEESINQNVVNSRLSLSFDMADSGLETGSVSPQESTVSENSGVDYEEPQEDSNKLSTARSSRQLEQDIQEGGRVELQKLKGLLESTSDYNSSDVYADATCSSSETEQQHLDSSSSYEDNLHRARANKEREDEISRYENQVLKDPFDESDSSSESEHATPFVQTTQSFEYVGVSPKPDGNSTSESSAKPASSYYFIDASSLNDDDIVANSSRQNFVPMNNDAVRDNVVEFQPNLRLTEHLEPPVEPRKVKRVFVDERVEKETLVVEIKETDSGENTQQTSPCPESMQGVIDNNAASNSATHQPNVERIPPLVRGNTFELDPSDQQKLSFLRQERERRQGTLVFQNSIQQYSGHRLDGNVFVPMDKYDFDAVEKETEPEKVSRCFAQTRSASHENVTDFEKESEECSMSLPVTLNHDPIKHQRPKFDKRWEAVPIVSGGARSEDFVQPKETMSPLSRRKTETTPIVSGGSVIINDEPKPKPKTRMSSSMAAWVVDMSDCNKPRPSNGTMSHSYSSSDCTRKSASQRTPKSSGFFVSFNSSMDSSGEQKSQNYKRESTKLKEQAATKSCEFYIDMSEKMERKKPRDKTASDDKKNMFSMFIDLSESPKSTDKSAKSEESSATEENSERDVGQRKSSGVFMFIESDSPVVRRRTLSSSRPPFKRHSWNTDKMNSASATTTSNGPPSIGKEILYRKEHKRAQSLSVDRIELRKFQARPSSSSHSLSESIRAEEKSQLKDGVAMDTSTEDMFEFENRDTPPNSHIEVLNEELRVSAKQRRDYRELTTQVQVESQGSESSVNWDKTATTASTEEGAHRKSETFDISSGSDNNDFELPEMQLNGGGESKSERGEKQSGESVNGRILETRKSLDEKIKEIECVLKEPESKEEEKEPSSFVRLSDLDKTPSQTCSVLEEEKPVARMSSSIPETSWIESKLAAGRSNVPVRCVPRKQTMSTSLPAKKSPLDDFVADGESENMVSESDLSSLQSSMGRSGAEGSTEETETSSFAGMKPYNRLGEDLLRMFLEEINPDVTIDVAGRRIRAHKCILSSRCQYFAAILSGGWIESEGNVISLQGYSYNAVHFALCHIYSGESNIPETISIVELATLADMLCLEGLKEVIGYTLKVKYCHLFHKPCQICAVGVLECMPLAAAYGLDEVYRKSLRWVTRHFVRIWPCKAFATLPRELMEKCYHQHIVHMSTENVLQTMMDCDKLIATLPNVRWAEPIFRLVSNLLDASMKFLSENMSGVLVSDSFQNLGRDLTWNISRLEDNFLAASERLPPEQACKTYSKLHKMIASSQTEDAQLRPKWGSLFLDFLRKIQSRVEKCLVRDATRAARTNAWSKMDLDLRRHIQELACLVILPNEIVKRPSRRTNFLKEPRIPPPPPPQKNTTANRNLDLRRVKMAISEHNDRTQKQSLMNGTNNVQPKKVLVKPKTDPMERKNLNLHDDKSGSDSNTSRPKSWPNKVEVKSRYLEPRHKSVPKNAAVKQAQEKSVVQQQRRKIMISSSDSSRTSSPAMKRASERKSLAKPKISAQKTTKALSSDSLAESNANKINNAKKTPTTVISKSLGITRPESPSLKAKEIDVGYSADSLVEPKSPRRAPLKKHQQPNKLEISMSEDSLATEMAATPRSTVSSKISPTLNRTQTPPVAKKSPPVQHKSPLSVTKRPQRSLECSTAASRSRAAAISSIYHPTPSLRRSLLDAAKTPDVGTIRQQQRAMPRQAAIKKDTKREAVSNHSSQESPSKRSPKSNGSTRIIARNQKSKEEKPKPKQNGELPRHLTVGSRSGTFLKDEPTILKKSDLKTAQIDS